MIGKKISHYKILSKLGEGGMGVVYKARDTKLDREVALKFLPANQLGTADDQKRFEQEAKAAAKLSHANIATVFEINEHEGATFIAMEYVDGETLSDMVEKRPLKIKDAIKIAKQIAEGLHSAHEQGIVHRDIKSANIMITDKGVVKIMDFGLAKLSKASMVTKAGTTLGTISYMSPEQTQGEKIDHRSDIWSLGVVLYEMGESKENILRAEMVLPEDQPLAFIGTVPLYYGRTALTLSRDGELFAYVAELASGTTQLVVKRMDEYESRLLPETEGAYAPFFSPDGSQLGFFADDKLKVVPLSGGSSRALSDARNPIGGVWNTKNEIIFSDNEGTRLVRISVQGGREETILYGNAEQPGIIPDGENLLVASDGILSIVSTFTGEITSLKIGSWPNPVLSPRYASSGHIVYMQGAQLMAVPFDIGTLQTSGRSIPVIENVRAEALMQMGQYAISDNGTLIYAPGGNVRVGHLVAATGQRSDEMLPFEPKIFGEMRLSPNGSQLALCVLGTTWDIWIYDLDLMTNPRRLTREGNNYSPVWTPDGMQIYFMSDRDGNWEIHSTSATSSGDVRKLMTNKVGQRPESISRDGKWLLYSQMNQKTKDDIFALSLDSDSTTQAIATSNYADWGGTFSPDGNSIAYQSDEAGRYQIYVKSFLGGSERMQVSANGGMDPVWSADGRSIYFNYVQDVYRVDINTDSELSIGIPTLLFSGEFIDLSGKGWAYDESRDRFILAKSVEVESFNKTQRRLELV